MNVHHCRWLACTGYTRYYAQHSDSNGAGLDSTLGIMAIAGRKWLEEKFLPWFGPVALLALIYTVLVLFGLQV